jgi:hypothetical protein
MGRAHYDNRFSEMDAPWRASATESFPHTLVSLSCAVQYGLGKGHRWAYSFQRSYFGPNYGGSSTPFKAVILGYAARTARTLSDYVPRPSHAFFFLPTPCSTLPDPSPPPAISPPPFGSLLFSDASDPYPQTLRPRRPHPKTLSFRASSAASTAARPRRRRLRDARHPGLRLWCPSIVSIAGVEKDDHHPHPDPCLLAKRAWPTTARTPQGVCGATTKPRIKRGIGFSPNYHRGPVA